MGERVCIDSSELPFEVRLILGVSMSKAVGREHNLDLSIIH